MRSGENSRFASNNKRVSASASAGARLEHLRERVGAGRREERARRVEGHVVDALQVLPPVRCDLLRAGARLQTPETHAAVVRAAQQVQARRVHRERCDRVLMRHHAVHQTPAAQVPEAHVLVVVRRDAQSGGRLYRHAVHVRIRCRVQHVRIY